MSALTVVAGLLGLAYERDDQGRTRKGTWMGVYSGGKFFPMDPRADEVTFEDVCIGLSRAFRYNAHTTTPYSVAEHCVLVSVLVEDLATSRGYDEGFAHACAQQGLLHDASEAYMGDLVRPIKHQPTMRGFRRAEEPIQNAVYEHFGVHPTHRTTALIKEVDNRLIVDEVNALMARPELYLARHENVKGLGAKIVGMSWERAAAAFTQRFCECFSLYPESTMRLANGEWFV